MKLSEVSSSVTWPSDMRNKLRGWSAVEIAGSRDSFWRTRHNSVLPLLALSDWKKKKSKRRFSIFLSMDRHAWADCLIPLVSFTPIICTETKVTVTRLKNVPVTEEAVILSYNGSCWFLSYAPNRRNQPNPLVARKHKAISVQKTYKNTFVKR